MSAVVAVLPGMAVVAVVAASAVVVVVVVPWQLVEDKMFLLLPSGARTSTEVIR